MIVKSDGQGAYISGDLAYYLDKRERGFDRCLIMLGADHHGYVGRLMAMCAAFGDEPGKNLEVLIGQMVNLLRDGKPLRMSKRAGTVITLDDLVEAIGVDAARYALARYTSTPRSTSTSTLWTKQSNDNPVFYVQYAHARLSAILRNAADLGIGAAGEFDPSLLAHEKEGDLLRALAEFPRVVAAAAAAARAAPGGPLPRGHRGEVPPVLRRLPGAADGRRGPGHRSTARGCSWSRRPARCSPTACGCSGSPPPSGCESAMRTHTRQAGRTPRGPPAARAGCGPRRRQRRWSRCSGRSTARKNDDGALEVGGVDVRDLVAEHGSPAYVLDEADFRARARAFREAFGGYDVFYAGKAFLCTTVARWVAEEGLCLDVCSGRRADRRPAGRLRPASRIGYHGNNKTTAELRRAVERRRRPDRRRLLPRDRAAGRRDGRARRARPG